MLKFFKNMITLFASTAIINIIETITNAYITQKVGTTVIGEYSLIMNLYNFLVTVSLFGIPLAITKIVSESDAVSDNETICLSTKIACKICAIISICVCIATIIFRGKISTYLLSNIEDDRIIILLGLSLPVVCVSSCICGYFNALRKVNISVIENFLSHIVSAITISSLIYIKYPTYISFGIGIFLSETISCLYAFFMYRHDIKKYRLSRNRKSTKKEITKNILKISAPISFTSFVRSGLSTLKHTLIPLRLEKFGFSSEYALSVYGLIHGIALPFVLMPSIFISCVSSLLLPEYSRLLVTGSNEKIQKITKKIFKIILNISLYISFVIFISSDIICYSIYKNTDVSYYVKILTPLIFIMYLDFIVDNMLRGLDFQVSVMKINIIDVVVSILLIYFGVPYLGTFGYILVIYTSEFLNGILSIELLLKKIHMSFDYLNWLIAPTIILFVSYLISKNIIYEISNYLSLALFLILFSVIFLFIYIIYTVIALKLKKVPSNS